VGVVDFVDDPLNMREERYQGGSEVSSGGLLVAALSCLPSLALERQVVFPAVGLETASDDFDSAIRMDLHLELPISLRQDVSLWRIHTALRFLKRVNGAADEPRALEQAGMPLTLSAPAA
jgi:hypothetical protein